MFLWNLQRLTSLLNVNDPDLLKTRKKLLSLYYRKIENSFLCSLGKEVLHYIGKLFFNFHVVYNQRHIENPTQGFTVIHSKISLPFIKKEWIALSCYTGLFFFYQMMIFRYMNLFYLSLIWPLFKIKVCVTRSYCLAKISSKTFYISVSPSPFSPLLLNAFLW